MIAVIGIPIGSSLLMLYPLLPGLMANIPFLGGMLLFLAMLAGTGRWLCRRYRASRPGAEVPL